MLVEDDPDLAAMAHEYLTRDGFEVVFDVMLPPLSVLFLAGLLYVAADIALRMPQRPQRHGESD